MKKLSVVLRILIFIMFTACPFIFKDSLGTLYQSGIDEKRFLAEKPILTAETISDFPGAYDAYVNDNLPFRDLLLTIYSKVMTDVFFTSPNEKVVIGKDGWLFYNSKAEGDPIESFRGRNLLSDEEVAKIVDYLLWIRQEQEAKGREFALIFAPIKSRIYPEYASGRMGEEAELYETTQVLNALLYIDPDYPVLYTKDSLLKSKEMYPDRQLYFKYDTHWTPYGAYIACYDLLKTFGIDLRNPLDEDLTFREAQYHDDGDLNMVLHQPKSEEFSLVKVKKTIEKPKRIDDKKAGGTRFIAEGADPRKLLVFQDSFYNYMMAYMSWQFNESYSVPIQFCESAFIDAEEPDIVVIEMTERNIRNLLQLQKK